MIRTQIYLPEELHQELLVTAKRDRTTLSELIRQGVRKILHDERKKDESWKVMARLAKFKLKGLPRDLSKNHDEYYVKAVLGED